MLFLSLSGSTSRMLDRQLLGESCVFEAGDNLSFNDGGYVRDCVHRGPHVLRRDGLRDRHVHRGVMGDGDSRDHFRYRRWQHLLERLRRFLLLRVLDRPIGPGVRSCHRWSCSLGKRG